MRQSKFEELVNLYIDGEISPSELQRLCRAMEKSPRRRAIFESYLRLNKATRHARFSAAYLINEVRTLREPRNYMWGVWGGASGALLAAVLFIFMGWSETAPKAARPAPLFAQASMEVEGYNPNQRPTLSQGVFDFEPQLVQLSHEPRPDYHPELRQVSLPQLHLMPSGQDLRYIRGQLVRLPIHGEFGGSLHGVNGVEQGGFMQVSLPATR